MSKQFIRILIGAAWISCGPAFAEQWVPKCATVTLISKEGGPKYSADFMDCNTPTVRFTNPPIFDFPNYGRMRPNQEWSVTIHNAQVGSLIKVGQQDTANYDVEFTVQEGTNVISCEKKSDSNHANCSRIQ